MAICVASRPGRGRACVTGKQDSIREFAVHLFFFASQFYAWPQTPFLLPSVVSVAQQVLDARSGCRPYHFECACNSRWCSGMVSCSRTSYILI